jgi:hypothetical protein
MRRRHHGSLGLEARGRMKRRRRAKGIEDARVSDDGIGRQISSIIRCGSAGQMVSESHLGVGRLGPWGGVLQGV